MRTRRLVHQSQAASPTPVDISRQGFFFWEKDALSLGQEQPGLSPPISRRESCGVTRGQGQIEIQASSDQRQQ